MDKRVILTIVISLVLMWGWLYMSQKLWPQAPQAPQASVPASAPATQSQGSPAQAAPGNAASAPAQAASRPAATQAARVPEEIVKLPQGRAPQREWNAALSTQGGALKHFELLGPRFKEESHGLTVPIDLVRLSGDASALPLRSSFRGKVIDVPPETPYRIERSTESEVLFVYDGPTARVEKLYGYDPMSYILSVKLAITSKSEARDDEMRVTVELSGWQNPEHKGGGWFAAPRNLVSGACYVNGKVVRESQEALAKKPEQRPGDVRWVGIDEKFFLLAALPVPGKDREWGCRLEGQAQGRVRADLMFAPRTLKPGGTETYELRVFAGPKNVKLLDAVTVPGQEPHLGEAVDFGWFAFIARPLLWILKFFQLGVRNWGLAIILLTIFVKLITLYWTQKSMRSMKDMAKLKPKISALQERFKDDKNRLNQEMMGLYKAHGVNPLSGCLPMLLQMPIWFALYSALQFSVELYGAPFVLWIRDLTAPDQYYVMPIVTGVLMFVQQKISPSPQDSQQAKMMMYMMPVMFTFFTLFVPSGLTLYILTNTLLSMAHQAWMNRGDALASAGAHKKAN
jgi:YidC/Oxa1 family membrane protein insertase